MNNNNERATASSLKGFLSGVLIGGLAGTTVVLLTAPQSGKKTRALIQHKSAELRDRAAETVDAAREQTDLAMQRARLQSPRVTRSVEATARQLQRRGQALLEDSKDRLESTLEVLQPATVADHSRKHS